AAGLPPTGRRLGLFFAYGVRAQLMALSSNLCSRIGGTGAGGGRSTRRARSRCACCGRSLAAPAAGPATFVPGMLDGWLLTSIGTWWGRVELRLQSRNGAVDMPAVQFVPADALRPAGRSTPAS